MRFTNLMHHIYEHGPAASGVLLDEENCCGRRRWRDVGELRRESRRKSSRSLSERLKAGGYRAKPVRRVFIAKADGKQRPLGVPVLEDKIVQRVRLRF